MRALITGGTGFLGSFLVRQWAERYGAESVVCLVPPTGTPAEVDTRTAFELEGITCIQGDLSKMPVAGSLEGPFDVIFHFAAATNTSWTEEQLAPVNVQGTRNLLDTFKGNLKDTRIVFTSTSAAVDRWRRPNGPLTEESPCVPRTAYGRTKLAAERIISEICEREGASYTIARLTTLYGPGVRTGMVPVLLEGLREGRLSARLNWPGRASMLFVEDAVRLLLFLAESPQAANETFFLSSGEAIGVGDLVRKLADLDPTLSRPFRMPRWFWNIVRGIAWTPGINRVIPWRLLHILHDGLWCDNSKVKRICPFELVQLDEGLRRTLRLAESTDCEFANAKPQAV